MKKKYLFIFLLAFAACASWNILTDTSKPAKPAAAASWTEKVSGWIPSAGTAKQKLYPYLHFREAINEKIKAMPMYVSISVIPRPMQQAVIATEDRRFYEHGAIDPIGIMRAMMVNFNSGETLEGGSTISQQVVKNVFLSHERTLTRKIQELVLSILLERNYTKDEILEIYLNSAYFGANATGIEDACRIYYGIPCDKLTLAQSSMLAGLLQAPTYYNPLENYTAARWRQQVVLALMAEQNYITQRDATRAYHEDLHLQK